MVSSGERVITQPTMLLRTAVLTTRMYQVTEKENNSSGSDPCIASTYTKTVSAKSRSFSINSTNGGELTAKDARLVYTDKANAQGFYANGRLFDGLISQTMMNTSLASSAEGDDPRSLDGEGGGDGTDRDLNDQAVAPRTTCFRKNSKPDVLTAQSGNGGVNGMPLVKLETAGPICETYVKRINWREIF